MNMTIEDKCVRVILGMSYSIITWSEMFSDDDTRVYQVMARPLKWERASYQRMTVCICGFRSEVLNGRLRTKSASEAIRIKNRLRYGLGSWCCRRSLAGRDLMIIIALSQRLQNRELNQGTY